MGFKLSGGIKIRFAQQPKGNITEQVKKATGGGSTKSADPIDADIARGEAFGKKVLGKDGLGRLAGDEEIEDVKEKFKEIAEEGLGTKESLVKRELANMEINRNLQTAARQLLSAQARRGVRGAVAGQQLKDLHLQALQQKADVERGIFLESESIKRQGLKDFSALLGQIKTFDLGQAAREKDIILQSSLGFAQIGSSERSARLMAQATEAAARAQAAAACFHQDTLIVMDDGSTKPIIEADIGDRLLDGGIVTGVSVHAIQYHDLCEYRGIWVTKNHPVYENNKWVFPKDSDLSIDIARTGTLYVYNLFTSTQRIFTRNARGENIIFTDYEGLPASNQYINNEIILEELNGNVGGVSKGKIWTQDPAN